MIPILEKGDLPVSLWNPSGVLHIPGALATAWRELLAEEGLAELAATQREQDTTGGLTKDETDKHLAWSFLGSVARVQLSVLDPYSKMPDLASMYERMFAGNRTILVDIPCGSGAGSLAILCTLAELRRMERLPRLPLSVTLLGGELSRFARNYSATLLAKVRAALYEQAIFFNEEILEWDACCPVSTTTLSRQMDRLSEECQTGVILVANFSGFLQRERKYKEAKPHIDEILRHFAEPERAGVWVEPQRNDAVDKGGLLHRIFDGLTGKIFKRIVRTVGSSEDGAPIFTSEAKFQHLANLGQPSVRLAVLHFTLDGGMP